MDKEKKSTEIISFADDLFSRFPEIQNGIEH